jgi:hypothetical protein
MSEFIMTLAQKELKRKAEVEGQISEMLSSHFKYEDRWLISDGMRAALSLDASKFYKKLDELKVGKDARLLLAVQMSLDNNKCPVNAITSWGSSAIIGYNVDVGFGNIQKARELTRVVRPKAEEYVDPLVSMLVRKPHSGLDEKKAKEVAGIAKETLEMYQRKRRITTSPLTLSAAAVYHAGVKAGSPVTEKSVTDITRVSEMSLRTTNADLLKTARPDEVHEWYQRKWKRSG